MRTRVKVCGITNIGDAEAAMNCGADALGFIFHKKSPRCVSPDKVEEIAKKLPPLVNTVGVFVNLEIKQALEIAKGCLLNTVQLHGDEDPGYCLEISSSFKVIKAVRVKDKSSLEVISAYSSVNAFLLDTYSKEEYGGSGKVFDWELARSASRLGRIILAGGLNPGNVAGAIREVKPYGVDVSSGVEKEPGIKDHEKLRSFFKAVGKSN